MSTRSLFAHCKRKSKGVEKEKSFWLMITALLKTASPSTDESMELENISGNHGHDNVMVHKDEYHIRDVIRFVQFKMSHMNKDYRNKSHNYNYKYNYEMITVSYFVGLFALMHHILDYGLTITKLSLTYKIPKCLQYLKDTIEINSIKTQLQNANFYQCFLTWWNILNLKYHLRTLSIKKKKCKGKQIRVKHKLIVELGDCISNQTSIPERMCFQVDKKYGIMMRIVMEHCMDANDILIRDFKLMN